MAVGGGRWCQAPQSSAVPLASKGYTAGMVGWGGFSRSVVNRYKRWLTAGRCPVCRWPHGPAADVQSAEPPCRAAGLPCLLPMAAWQRPAGVDRHPRPGGIGPARRWGDPPTKCAIFSGLLWVCWSPVLQRLPWIWTLRVVAGWVSRSASPHSAPEQPASPAGHPSCASLRWDSHEGEEGVFTGVEGNREGPAFGVLGSTAAMGPLERSSDQLPNGPVVARRLGGSFIGAAIGTKRQPSPRLGCETRSGGKRAV
jgi:hypothetical protein